MALDILHLHLLMHLGSGRSRGRPRCASPYGPKISQFHAVFRKIWQNHMLAPPQGGGLAPPPMGNPGSAPARCIVHSCWCCLWYKCKNWTGANLFYITLIRYEYHCQWWCPNISKLTTGTHIYAKAKCNMTVCMSIRCWPSFSVMSKFPQI